MFQYTICSEPDEAIFRRQCAALEKRIIQLQKGKLLLDVDGSKTQFYTCDGKSIRVLNSYYLGGVFLDSEMDLELFFG